MFLRDYTFHHMGYATESFVLERDFFIRLGYAQADNDFSDPEQGVQGCFLEGPGPRLELLQNLPGSNTLTPWLNAGIKLYHFAYQVKDLNECIEWARNQRGRMVVAPVPATAFKGRHICFFVFREGPMIEFIEM